MLRKSLRVSGTVTEAVREVSFSVRRGEFVALLGPSGSGKSTLLGIVAGLDQPNRGAVHLEGGNITDMHESELAQVRNRKIGMVFQAFNLIPTLTAQENVELPLSVGSHRSATSSRARALLDVV